MAADTNTPYSRTHREKIIILLLLMLSTAAPAHEAYKYIDPLFPEKRITINVVDKSFLVADTSEKMSICGIADKYTCISTKQFWFAVPKKIAANQTEWSFGNKSYRADPTADRKILDQNMRLTKINWNGPDISYFYLYSSHHGLVGIGFMDSKTKSYNTYLLEGSCGLGASPQCK